MAVAMQYSRRVNKGIYHMYGLPAKSAAGSVLRGSYNLYISQESELWLLNLGNSQDANVSVTRFDGTQVLRGAQIGVPANGLSITQIGDFEIADTYGLVTVQGQEMIGWILRRRGLEYVIPLPLDE